MTYLKIVPFTNNSRIICSCGLELSVWSLPYHLQSYRHRHILDMVIEVNALRNEINNQN